jgi:hypothetical protein
VEWCLPSEEALQSFFSALNLNEVDEFIAHNGPNPLDVPVGDNWNYAIFPETVIYASVHWLGECVDLFPPVDTIHTAPRKVKHPNKEHPSLQILVPLWLQKDRESQKNLFNHLLGSNERRWRGYNMRKICKETQCRVSIDWDEEGDSLIPMIINIFDPKTAAEKRFNCLQRARRMIQHLLLEFVGNDGSQGRLVYEIASSCSGSHRPTKSTSNAVREINPLSHDVRSVFMSIIDLPYDYVEHHSLRQVEAFGCQLNIVAAAHQFTDGFTTTNLCDPYVLVSVKKNYENVDKAVKMLKTMISES